MSEFERQMIDLMRDLCMETKRIADVLEKGNINIDSKQHQAPIEWPYD